MTLEAVCSNAVIYMHRHGLTLVALQACLLHYRQLKAGLCARQESAHLLVCKKDCCAARLGLGLSVHSSRNAMHAAIDAI